MVKIVFDFLQFLLASAPLVTSLAVFTLLSVALAGFVKRRSQLCYLIAAIPALLVAVPMVLRWCGVETPNLTAVPVLGQILRDYIHMGTLGHPLLIVIMYMGALDARIPFVKRLMSIRGELSILSGFPVLTHSLVRVANNLPSSLRFFTDNEGYLASTPVASATGAGISSFSFLLGVLILAIFLPLWITSFPAVRRRMGAARWKRLQRWAYVFYAAMFIHAVGIQVGGMLNPRGGGASRPAVEASAAVSAAAPQTRQASEGERLSGVSAGDGEARGNNGRPVAGAEGDRSQGAQAARTPSSGGRVMPKGFADFKVGTRTRQWIHLGSLFLIYGSYLCLRLRKRSNKTGTPSTA